MYESSTCSTLSLSLSLSVFRFGLMLVGVKGYLIVLICIFLMTDAVEHHFMYLLAIPVSSLVKCLFKFFYWIVFLARIDL